VKEAENEEKKRTMLEESFAKVKYDAKMSDQKHDSLKDKLHRLKNENSGLKNRLSELRNDLQ